MTQQTAGLLIGGVIPAVLLGCFAILQKLSVNLGSTPASLLLFVGVGVTVVALTLGAVGGFGPVTLSASVAALATGVVWATSTALIAVAQGRFGAPVVQLVPLFNMNTLVAVLLGFIVFAEWRGVRVPRLVIGSVLIVVGGTLVATS